MQEEHPHHVIPVTHHPPTPGPDPQPQPHPQPFTSVNPNLPPTPPAPPVPPTPQSPQPTPFQPVPPSEPAQFNDGSFSTEPADQPKPEHSSAVQVVWQLVTYSLWSWSFIAMSILLSGTLSYFFVDKTSSYEFLIYTMAALIVLLPMAFVADKFFYSKQEPPVKHGFAAVAMVLCAVPVFLVTLGGLITAVVMVFNILLNPGDLGPRAITIISSLVVTVLWGLLFVRIIHPPRIAGYSRLFPVVAVTIAGLTVLLAIIGPFRSEFSARSDRLIEDNLSTLSGDIQSYARKNDKLPDSLDQVDTSTSGSGQLVDSGKVTYKKVTAGTTSTKKITPGSLSSSRLYDYSSSLSTARYELCATYKKAKGNDSSNSYDDDYASSYVSTYSHKAGVQCYTISVYID